MTKRSHWPDTSQRFLLLSACVLLFGLLGSTRAEQGKPAAGRSTLRIYLARHGQTDWNVERRTQGRTDIPLNAAGRQQAQDLKDLLVGVQLEAVYSSTLRRSRETAGIVHGEIPVTSLQDLAERGFGKFEGRLVIDPLTGPEFERRRWTPDDSLDGGESLNALEERVRATLDAIRKQHASGSILIVGHSYTNRMILAVLFGLTIEQMRSFDQVNSEIYVIELASERAPQLLKLITKANLTDL